MITARPGPSRNPIDDHDVVYEGGIEGQSQGNQDEPSPEINQMDPEVSGFDIIEDENGKPKLKKRNSCIFKMVTHFLPPFLPVNDKCERTLQRLSVTFALITCSLIKRGLSKETKSKIPKFGPKVLLLLKL